MAEQQFDQRHDYDLGQLRLSFPLRGPAYRFSLLLPELNSSGDVIFGRKEREDLQVMFSRVFGGYTCTESVTQPLMSGGYLDKDEQHIVDSHTLFEVYTRQSREAVRYFEDLGKNLTLYSRTIIAQRVPGYLGEEQIIAHYTSMYILDTAVPRVEEADQYSETSHASTPRRAMCLRSCPCLFRRHPLGVPGRCTLRNAADRYGGELSRD